MSILEKGFINQEGKITWTAVAVAYGLVLITLITAKWLIEDEVSLSYLEWSTVIIPILLGARPAQRAFQSFGGYISRHKKEVPEIGLKTANKEVREITKSFTGIPGTANFTIDEFHCKDGTKVPEKLYPNLQRLMINLEVIRAEMNHRYAKKRGGEIKLHISSGYRTPSHNKKVKGSKDSRHMHADGSDIFPELATPKELYDCTEDLIEQGEVTPGGLSLYERSTNHVHYDARGVNERW